MYCENCGHQLNKKALYCQNCGQPVNAGATPAADPANPIPAAPIKKKKKSIFKRWWFWVLVIILLFVSCVGTSDPGVTHPDVSEAEYKAMCEEIAFDPLARNPDNYEGQMFQFTGEVIQVAEGNGYTNLRMNVTAVDDGGWTCYEDTIYVLVKTEEGSDRILDYDIVTVYGICTGSYTYESIFGEQITLPGIEAMYYEIVS